MNKRIVIALVLVTLLVASVFTAASPAAAQGGGLLARAKFATCADLNISVTGPPTPFVGGLVYLKQGQTITLVAQFPIDMVASYLSVQLLETGETRTRGPEYATTMSFSAWETGHYALEYTFGDGDPRITSEVLSQTTLTLSCGDPGCDAYMDIPETAVGGTFVADAPVFWAPGELIDVVITAGNSARVLGVDASGEYYKIIWVCDYLWVPKSSLGPNYDAVWNGAPLPTEVVE